MQKKSKKNLNYKNLHIEIQRMWNMRCFVIPVNSGATGIVTKSLNMCLEAIQGKHSVDSQKKKKD